MLGLLPPARHRQGLGSRDDCLILVLALLLRKQSWCVLLGSEIVLNSWGEDGFGLSIPALKVAQSLLCILGKGSDFVN